MAQKYQGHTSMSFNSGSDDDPRESGGCLYHAGYSSDHLSQTKTYPAANYSSTKADKFRFIPFNRPSKCCKSPLPLPLAWPAVASALIGLCEAGGM